MWVSIGRDLKWALYIYIRADWKWARPPLFSLSHSKLQFIPMIGLYHPDSWLSNLHKFLPETLIRIQNNHSRWVRERIDLARDLQMSLRHDDEESQYIPSMLSLISLFLNLFLISSPAGSRYPLFGFQTFFVVKSSFYSVLVSLDHHSLINQIYLCFETVCFIMNLAFKKTGRAEWGPPV